MPERCVESSQLLVVACRLPTVGLRQRSLTNSLQRSQPTPSGTGIRVEFEAVAFDDLVLWMGDLNRQYGLQVESANFSVASSESPGRVNSSVTLQR